MDFISLVLAVASVLSWMGFVLLPWGSWRNREILEAVAPDHKRNLQGIGDVTVLIPARNEAEVIERTLASLVDQASDLSIILVNDGSEDTTVECARQLNIQRLQIIESAPLPAGWSGKLWALEQGRRLVKTPYVLLLDADIELVPGMFQALREKMRAEAIRFISVMAFPSMSNGWEKLAMPAFVYFFKILYPFRLVNTPGKRMAGAAGGCILTESRLLDQIGGFASVSSAVIDDCALAYQIKSHGWKIWLGLTRSARSIRRVRHPGELWDMVARTAFTQLGYSATLLVFCTLAMLLIYAVPLGLFVFSDGLARHLSEAALFMMIFSYMPTLRFYKRSLLWSLSLPLTAMLFLAMTWASAIRYWRGERTRWKGRRYARTSQSCI
ncbi:MAG TPA: glycosyltransferase [Terriglobales bacterium]|nr:glycosyltransferase [Terriglobales bacterium]